MAALPAWTRLADDDGTRLLVDYLSMHLPMPRSGAVAHGTVRQELERQLTSPAAKIAKRFMKTASQGDLLPCRTLLVATDASLRLEVYAQLTFPRACFALARTAICFRRCGTYAVDGGRRVIWAEFPPSCGREPHATGS